MTSSELRSLPLTRAGRELYVDIDHPPTNLLDADLFGQLNVLVGQLEQDTDSRVVVFGSADTDYFLAHNDVKALLSRPPTSSARTGGLKPFHQLLERYRR